MTRTMTAAIAASGKSRLMIASFVAIALAAAALLLSPAPAFAVDNQVDPGVRCAAEVGPGEYELYLPGAKVTDKDGNKWVCGPDGQWFRDYSVLTVFRYSASQVLASSTLTR